MPSLLQSRQALTGHLLLHQVLQRQADGVVLHSAGDDMGRGPLRWARLLGCVPPGGVDGLELPHHRVNHQIIGLQRHANSHWQKLPQGESGDSNLSRWDFLVANI